MLTELQRRVRSIVTQLPESGAFALAGGAALIVSGIVQRATDDLDFFAPYPQGVGELLEAAHAALEADGLRVARLHVGSTFARLQIDSDTDSTTVDLAADHRLMPALLTEEGAVLAERELAADKTLALAARVEPRDYIDFQALADHFKIDELCELAAEKDLGFRPRQLADALDYFDHVRPSAFNIDDDAYGKLRAFVAGASRHLNAAHIEHVPGDTTPPSAADNDNGLTL